MLKRTILVTAVLCAGCGGETPEQKAARETRQMNQEAEQARSQRHSESMKKWYAENPDTDAARINRGEDVSSSGSGERYLDSRTGAALERTVKRVISMAGYDCDRIRTIERMEAGAIARLSAEDGRWVDCNEDGVYWVIESADGFRAVKR